MRTLKKGEIMAAETIANRIVYQYARELPKEKQNVLAHAIELALLRQLERVRTEFYTQGYEAAKKEFKKETIDGSN